MKILRDFSYKIIHNCFNKISNNQKLLFDVVNIPQILKEAFNCREKAFFQTSENLKKALNFREKKLHKALKAHL